MQHPSHKSLDRQRSVLYGAMSGAQLGQCYANAWKTVHLFHPLVTHYAEGWFILTINDHLIIYEHAWCESSMHVIDPTISNFHGDEKPLGYFPGVSYSLTECEHIGTGSILPHVRFSGSHGPDGLQHEGYRHALINAFPLAGSTPHHLPIAIYPGSTEPIRFSRRGGYWISETFIFLERIHHVK